MTVAEAADTGSYRNKTVAKLAKFSIHELRRQSLYNKAERKATAQQQRNPTNMLLLKKDQEEDRRTQGKKKATKRGKHNDQTSDEEGEANNSEQEVKKKKAKSKTESKMQSKEANASQFDKEIMYTILHHYKSKDLWLSLWEHGTHWCRMSDLEADFVEEYEYALETDHTSCCFCTQQPTKEHLKWHKQFDTYKKKKNNINNLSKLSREVLCKKLVHLWNKCE